MIRKANYFLLGLSVAIVVAVALTSFSYFESLHGNMFDHYFVSALLRPLLWSTLVIILVLTFFLFLPQNYFRNWILGLASWYIPLSAYIVTQVDVYSTDMLAQSRTTIALWTMYGLVLLTLIFLLLNWYVRMRRPKNNKPS